MVHVRFGETDALETLNDRRQRIRVKDTDGNQVFVGHDVPEDVLQFAIFDKHACAADIRLVQRRSADYETEGFD